jgi:archaeosine synthase beta-subunit
MKQVITETLASLRCVLRPLHATLPRVNFPVDRAASSDIRTGYIRGKPVQRLVITFRAPGCSWVTRGGGCLMCGHYAGTTRGIMPSVENIITQFQRELLQYDVSSIEIISLYNSGSVLNPAEFHPEALEKILQLITKIPTIKKVVVESRAEFVDVSHISELQNILSPRIALSIAIGLETADDEKRDLCLNKGSSLKEISSALSKLNGCAETQLYVLMGLPFLTESEIIEDTVASLKCAREMGANEIHIEPLTIQHHTFTALLAQAGLFRLPSLYSLYEILRIVVPDITPYVSPFLHMPLPEKIPEGCPLCTERLLSGLLKKYNIIQSRGSLEYEWCDCIPVWRERLKTTDPRPLVQRVSDSLKILSCEVMR